METHEDIADRVGDPRLNAVASLKPKWRRRPVTPAEGDPRLNAVASLKQALADLVRRLLPE